MLLLLKFLIPVSYTHLDVYKRQVVDEGLGGRSRFSWFISRIHDGINPLKSFITFLQEITLDKISYSQLVKKGCLIDQTLFVKKHGNFFVQNKLAEKYRSILETRNLADDKQNFSIYENAIIINTQQMCIRDRP